MITVKCKMCGKQLHELGAIVLSPPEHNNIFLAVNEEYMQCVKYHICVLCYDKLYDFMDSFEEQQ